MSEKPTWWNYITTTIVALLCACWAFYEYKNDPDKIPFEPLIAFVTGCFAIWGYSRWKKGKAEDNVSNQTAEKIYNIGEIKDANFSIYVKGGYVLALLGLLSIGIWQKETINQWLGNDRFFKEQDENFKILILPFKHICEMSGKNYDAGYVLAERLNEIARKENLKITAKYWEDYEFDGYFFEQNARELQEYHFADMLIYGSYQTSDCSAEGDQICLNYVTAEKWNMGKAGENFSADYQKGGYDDVKKGKVQEKIENIAVLVSILGQIKSLDHAAYLEKLQRLLNDPDFSTNSKMNVYLELADKLMGEGKLEQCTVQFEKGLEFAVEQKNKKYQGVFLSRLGETHMAFGNLPVALGFFEQFNALIRELHEANPQNVDFKNGLAISYSKLGETHTALGNLPVALEYFEKDIQLSKELHEAYPQNVDFKNSLASSYRQLGGTYTALGNLEKSLPIFEKTNKLSKELHEAYPQNVNFKNLLASSYEKLGETHFALGNLPVALGFFEKDLEMSKELYEANPQNVDFKNGLAISYQFLGATHRALGNLPVALGFFEQYNTLEAALHEAYPQNVQFKNSLAISCQFLGATHRALDNLPTALGFFEQCNALFKELHEANPQNVDFKNGLAISYEKLGTMHTALGNLPVALGFFEQYNALESELHKTYPQYVEFKNHLAISYQCLGNTHTALGNLPMAWGPFEEMSKLSKELHEAYPQNVEFKNGLAISYQYLGNTHTALGNLPKALGYYEQYNALEAALYEAYPQSVEFKKLLAISYLKLGQLFRDQYSDAAKARPYIQKGHDLYAELVRDFPDYQEFQGNYEWSKEALGQ